MNQLIRMNFCDIFLNRCAQGLASASPTIHEADTEQAARGAAGVLPSRSQHQLMVKPTSMGGNQPQAVNTPLVTQFASASIAVILVSCFLCIIGHV